jgi:GH24 family phage-related lysozyme (muramidase)
MEFRLLAQDEYDRKLREVIVGTEGHHAGVQDVGDGLATIGWGYTLNNHENMPIWRRAGIELTPEQTAVLEHVDRAPEGRKTAIGLTFDKVLTETESDRLLRASIQAYEAPAVEAGMPLSDERVAVVSVTYNRGPGVMRSHEVMGAIRDGDRAEAWYQLRYNCWGSKVSAENGLRKRRFAEAEIFGLYDDPEAVSVEEAAAVYAMYREHHAEIDRVERRFGVTVNGVEARPNRIAHANRDYPDIVAIYGEVQTIADSLEPARSRLLGHLRERYPTLAGELTEERFNAGLIDPERFPREFAVVAGQGVQPGSPAVAHRMAGPAATQHGPFQSGHLNAAVAALGSDDPAQADRALRRLAESPEGQAFLHMGEEARARGEEAAREAVVR